MDALLIKNRVASGAIAAYRFVKEGASDGQAVQAGLNDKILGVSDQLAHADGERADVKMLGQALVQLGGVVTRGDFLYSDANGCGITAAFPNSTTTYVGARAEVSGVSGDIVLITLCPFQVNTNVPEMSQDVTLTSAQILALFTTPITAIAAPGAGYAVIVKNVTAKFSYATAAYTESAGDDLTLKYTDANGTALITIDSTGFLTANSDQLRYQPCPTVAAITPVDNAPVVLHQLAHNLAAGSGTLRLRIRYAIVPTTW